MNELKLPIRYYYSLSEAAKELGCTENDLIHWGATQQIEMLAFPKMDWHGFTSVQLEDREKWQRVPFDNVFVVLVSAEIQDIELYKQVQIKAFEDGYVFTNDGFGLLSDSLKQIDDKKYRLIHYFSLNPTGEYDIDGVNVTRKSLYISASEVNRIKDGSTIDANIKNVISKRPVQISSQHRENLLRRIKAEGLDALQLTAGKGGKSGSKAQIKALLVPNTMTNSQFDKTWESAMRDQVIQYKP